MPQRPPKAWFDRCVKSAVSADDPKALCGWIWHHHMTEARKAEVLTGAGYDPGRDLPEPKDMQVRAEVLIRVVPEVDDLFEVAIYAGSYYNRILEFLKDTKTEAIPGGRVRRGKQNPATNIFIMG